MIVKIIMCQFVSNFLTYVSAKYYLNWFTVGRVITKIKRVDFLLRHSVHLNCMKPTFLLIFMFKLKKNPSSV